MRRIFYLWRLLALTLVLGTLLIAGSAQAATGPLLAYIVPRDDTQAVVLRRAGGGHYREMTLPADFNPAGHSLLSPNGRWFAHYTGAMSLPGEGPSANLTLHILDLERGEQVRSFWLAPPDFPANITETARLLLARDPSLGEMTELPQAVYAAFHSALGISAWSPDGEHLAFSGAMDGPTTDVYLYTPASDTVARLTDGIEQINELRWSPDGAWIWHNTIAYGYCQVCDGHKYAAAADGARVLALPGDEIDRHLGWVDDTTYLETDQANGPGNFDLRLVDLTGAASRTLWPGVHEAFALDLGRERLAVTGAITSTGWVFPTETFLVDLNTGDYAPVDDPATITGADAELLDALAQANRYPCQSQPIVVRPCRDAPWSPRAPDGSAEVAADGALVDTAGTALLPPAPALAGGAVFWRPDGAGYFVIQGTQLSYRDRASGKVTHLDRGVRALEWLTATAANTDPDPAELGSTLAGSVQDTAYALREAQAAQLAQLALDPSAPRSMPGLPLLLAQEAVLTTQRPVFDLIPAPYVLPQAEAALQTALEEAPPWIGQFPADGPLSSLRSLAISDDGAWLATGHSDGALRLWEVQSGRLARTLHGETTGIQQVAFSTTGDYLAAAAENGMVHIWDLDDWMRSASYAGRYTSVTALAWEPGSNSLLIANGDDPVQRLEVHGDVTDFLERPAELLAFSPDGQRVAAALRTVYPLPSGETPRATQPPTQPPQPAPILLRDLVTGQEVELSDPEGTTYILAFSPDGRYLVSASAYELQVWDAADGAQLHTLRLPDFPNGWAFVDDHQLVVLSRRFGLTWVDVAAGRILHSLPVDANVIGWLAYDAAAGRLFSAETGGRPVALDTETGAISYPFDNPQALLVVGHPTLPLAVTAGGKLLEVRDLDTGATLHTLDGLPGVVTAVAFSADGARVLAGDATGRVVVWEVDGGARLNSFQAHPDRIIALEPAGDDLLVTAGAGDSVAVWQTSDWRELHRLTFPQDVLAAAASSSGEVGIATRDGDLLRYNAETGEPLLPLEHSLGRTIGLRYSPDGRTLVAAAENGPVALWDTATAEIAHTLPLTGTFFPFGLAFSPDGRTLATGPANANLLTLWDVASGEQLNTLPTVAKSAFNAASSLAFDARGERLLVAEVDQVTRLYTLTPTRSLRTFTGHGGSVWEAGFSPDGRYLLTGSEDGSMRLWDWQSGGAVLRFPGTPARLFDVAYSPLGDTVAAVGIDGGVHLYLSGGAPQAVLTGHTSWVDTVTYSPDGRMLATSGDDRTVRVWNLDSRRERWRVETPDLPGALAFSPDGTLLAGAVGGYAATAIYLWDAASGEVLATLTGHDNYVVGLAFSPDGAWLASASWDRTAKLWDIASGEERLSLAGHREILTGIAVSPDGTRLATVAEDYTLRLWDAATGEALDRIDLPRALPWSVAFSPDGVALVTTHWDGQVRTWLVDPADDSLAAQLLIASARTPRASAEFSGQERRRYGIDAFVGAYPLSASGQINVRADTVVRSLVVYPTAPETLVALSDQQFLLQSTDRGTTWAILARLPLTLTVNSLGLPARPDDPLLLAAEQGLFRYNVDGTLALLHGDAIDGVSFSHTSPDELWGIREDTVVKSEDGGATWGEASNELRSTLLLPPLIMAPANNNPQFVLGYGETSPGIQLWRGAGNDFWKRLPAAPVLPLGLANGFGLAWDAGSGALYQGGAQGELYALENAAAPDENTVTATLAHDFGEQGRVVPLAVGQGPTLYLMLYGRGEPRFLRGAWDGTTWTWQTLRLPLDAAG